MRMWDEVKPYPLCVLEHCMGQPCKGAEPSLSVILPLFFTLVLEGYDEGCAAKHGACAVTARASQVNQRYVEGRGHNNLLCLPPHADFRLMYHILRITVTHIIPHSDGAHGETISFPRSRIYCTQWAIP